MGDLLKAAKISRKGAQVHVSGEMTFATIRRLLTDSKGLFQGEKNLKLNLMNVTHADSAGLALVFEWIATAKLAGGKLTVQGMPQSLLDIAQLCGVEKVLQSVVGKGNGARL